MFDELVTDTAGRRGASAVDAWTRVESAACARRLAAMVTLLDDAHAADGSADREQWCLDNWAAVCAHIGATARLTHATASALLLVATALRDRFPKVQALFMAGLIDYRMVRAIVTRSALLTDPDARRALDTALAQALVTWGPMSVDKTQQCIDTLIEAIDPLAVRRTQTQARSRSVQIDIEDGTGLAVLFATLLVTDATALDARLDALADTVCPGDPRTKDQRRCDALGALSHAADRLTCLCDTTDCPAAANPPSTGVVIYVVAHQDTLTEPPPHEPNAPEDPDGPDALDGPDDPDTPDAPEESPVLDGTNDSDGSPVSDGSSVPDDHAVSDDAGSADHADGPHDPDSPDASEDSPITDGTNDSDDPTDRWAPDDAESPEGQAAPDEVGSADDADRAACDHSTADRTAAEYAGLDGPPLPVSAKPWREVTWADLAHPDPGPPATIRPAALMGGQFLPGSIARRAALGATLTAIIHPGQAPPEPHYRPSKKLADFIRCRDMTCRFPGCKEPATNADIDHTIPWPYGPTQAANLRCLCRKHHLLKTFWAGEGGWRDRQLPDGTIIWTAPDGRTHRSTPGSRLLFPELCQPTAAVAPVDVPTQPTHTAELKMPRRKTTRTQDRARRIHHERTLNAAAAEAAQAQRAVPKPPQPAERS